MKSPDINDTMMAEGAEGVRRRSDNAKPYNATAGGDSGRLRRLLVHSGDFVRGYVAPEYAIEGVLQKRRIYGITGRTGDGKTAIKLCFARYLADGLPIAGHETEKCRVLYMAGENPDDVTARWIAMAEHMGFNPDEIDVYFMPGVFKISELYDAINAEADALGGVGAVMVDTSAAYYEADDENDNVQMGAHARMLRRLTEIAGGPCVIVGCHPHKSATDENMLPRGGYAFICEIDGNLTAIAADAIVEMYWVGKFRGPDFEPLHFEISSVTAEKLHDSKGRPVWTAIAKPVGSVRHAAMEDDRRSNQDQVILVLDQSPDFSMAQIAETIGWKYADGRPDKTKVNRVLKSLQKARYAENDRGNWSLTPKGKNAAKRLRSR